MSSSIATATALRRGFERLLEAVVILLTVTMAAVVLAAIVYRKAGASLVWYDEVASVILAWLTYYGAALAALKRAHIGFPGLVEALSPRWRVPLLIASETVVIAFFLLLAWFGWRVLEILEGDSLVSLTWVPTALVQSVIPIGALLYVLAQLASLPEALTEARAGLHHKIVPEEPDA